MTHLGSEDPDPELGHRMVLGVRLRSLGKIPCPWKILARQCPQIRAWPAAPDTEGLIRPRLANLCQSIHCTNTQWLEMEEAEAASEATMTTYHQVIRRCPDKIRPLEIISIRRLQIIWPREWRPLRQTRIIQIIIRVIMDRYQRQVYKMVDIIIRPIQSGVIRVHLLNAWPLKVFPTAIIIRLRLINILKWPTLD